MCVGEGAIFTKFMVYSRVKDGGFFRSSIWYKSYAMITACSDYSMKSRSGT